MLPPLAVPFSVVVPVSVSVSVPVSVVDSVRTRIGVSFGDGRTYLYINNRLD